MEIEGDDDQIITFRGDEKFIEVKRTEDKAKQLKKRQQRVKKKLKKKGAIIAERQMKEAEGNEEKLKEIQNRDEYKKNIKMTELMESRAIVPKPQAEYIKVDRLARPPRQKAVAVLNIQEEVYEDDLPPLPPGEYEPILHTCKELKVDPFDVVEPIFDQTLIYRTRLAAQQKIVMERSKQLEQKARELGIYGTDEDELQRVRDEISGFELFSEVFADEVELPKVQYEWEAQYKRRKPAYFNRVHCGFEWNLYMKSHFEETTPPKVVQGYKFNIFFPDLVYKSRAPQFKLTKMGNDEKQGLVTISFMSGPPYETIAFRIVDKEWDQDNKHGFRCSYDRGILRLYLRFKRPKHYVMSKRYT